VQAGSPDEVADALDGDPFNRERLIIERTVREWAPVGDHPWG